MRDMYEVLDRWGLGCGRKQWVDWQRVAAGFRTFTSWQKELTLQLNIHKTCPIDSAILGGTALPICLALESIEPMNI